MRRLTRPAAPGPARAVLLALRLVLCLAAASCAQGGPHLRRIAVPKMVHPAPERDGFLLPAPARVCGEASPKAPAGAVFAPGIAVPSLVRDGSDPRASEPAAVALVDRMIERAGGSAAWRRVQEFGWLEGSVIDGRLRAVNELVWDRVHDRMRRVWLSAGGAVSVAMGARSGRRGAGYRVLPSGCGERFMGPVRARVLAGSAALVRSEGFLLALPFSLRSRGVRVALVGTRVTPTVLVRNDEPPRYDVLGVTVTDAGGRVADRFKLVVDRRTARPVLLERARPDGVLEGTYLRDWQNVGGLWLATRRDDAGSTQGAALAPFSIPAAWRGQVHLRSVPVPARGAVTIARQIALAPDVDADQFVPPPLGRDAP